MSIATPQFTEGEVMDVINSLRNSSAGYDFLPTKIAKKITSSFIKPLTRPITVLSFFSRIFEKLAYIHLINFFN